MRVCRGVNEIYLLIRIGWRRHCLSFRIPAVQSRIRGVDKHEKDVFVCASACVCLFVCVSFMRSDFVTLILRNKFNNTHTPFSLSSSFIFLFFTHTWFCGVFLIVSQHLSDSLGASNDQTSKTFQ